MPGYLGDHEWDMRVQDLRRPTGGSNHHLSVPSGTPRHSARRARPATCPRTPRSTVSFDALAAGIALDDHETADRLSLDDRSPESKCIWSYGGGSRDALDDLIPLVVGRRIGRSVTDCPSGAGRQLVRRSASPGGDVPRPRTGRTTISGGSRRCRERCHSSGCLGPPPQPSSH